MTSAHARLSVLIVVCIHILAIPLWACADSPSSQPQADVQPLPTSPAWDDFKRQRTAWLKELAQSAWHCVQQPDTAHVIFSGCYDWHSAVHGHWALLRVARLTGDKQHLAWLAESLNAKDVAAEAAYMRDDLTFEMPYGRAWFLLLAIEHNAVTQSNTLDAMAAEIAQSLRDFYTKTPPNPLSEEYNNASWALTCLTHYYAYTKNTDGLKWAQSQVQAHMTAPNPDISPGQDLLIWPEFFSRWGNWALVLTTALGPQATQAWLKPQTPPTAAALSPIKEPLNAHHMSMNFSRAWSFWALFEATGDTAYRDLYISHITLAMHDHPALKDDYGRYGHWVSQFGIFALSISELGVDQDPKTPLPYP
jgi:hypothetical protein